MVELFKCVLTEGMHMCALKAGITERQKLSVEPWAITLLIMVKLN